MEKTLFGIEKKDFRNAYIDGVEICIDYIETYDHDAVHSTKFTNQEYVENNEKNIYLIKDFFGFDLNEGKSFTVRTVRAPEHKAVVGRIDVVTNLWFTCPNCGCTESYEIEGTKKRADINYIITTECCKTRISLKGIK